MIAEQTFLNEHGFTAYRDYLAIKRHFTSSYDYFKYNGKVNVSQDSFVTRRDAYQFQRLSKKRDYQNLILSNVIVNPKIWVGSLLEDSANRVYLDWKKTTDAITRHIQDDLSKLDDDFKINFVVPNGQYPHIIDLYMRKELSLETVTILTKLTNSSGYWQKSVVDKVVFPDIVNKIDKYHPFLVYSPEKMKKVVKDHFF
jgi:hypothetical protein